jgi:hypothetical protein
LFDEIKDKKNYANNSLMIPVFLAAINLSSARDTLFTVWYVYDGNNLYRLWIKDTVFEP